jgi:caa(3)-type oxidase subunit IV
MSDTQSSSPAPAPQDPHAPASDAHAVHDHHDLDHHIRMYWIVGGVLFFFTGFTVALSYMDFDKWFHGHGWNMKIGMAVAFFKVCLVAAIFMHLKEEKSTIWRFIYFTLFFVAGLFLLTLLAWADPIFGTHHLHH